MDVSGTFVEEFNAYVKEREDLETPHNCTAEIEAPEAGADLEQLETHAAEFHKMVEEMFEKLPEETPILEGVEIPTYEELRAKIENELSETNPSIDNGRCAGSVDS